MSTTIQKQAAGSNISDTELFISRELSWLAFNARVLEEAQFAGNPPLERLKFIAIFSSNLDEFFMVRVAGLLRKIRSGSSERDPAGNTPLEQWRAVRKRCENLIKKQYSILNDEILPQLERYGIFIRKYRDLDPAVQDRLRDHFVSEILPALTPRAVDPLQPFPLINAGSIQIALKLWFPKNGRESVALIEVPELLERFIALSDSGDREEFILCEELIIENVQVLFKGAVVRGCQLFRLTRDMDYSVNKESAEELLHELQDKLRHRRRRAPVRLEFSAQKSCKELQKYLAASLEMSDDLCFILPDMLDFEDFSKLSLLLKNPEALFEKKWQAVIPDIFRNSNSVFEVISREKNILLAHPYQSFDPVLKLLEEAAEDPSVVAIKQTLYRVSGNSPVVRALRKAAENGKQVTVLVELKARFDESNNIAWAELLDQSGAHVIYGVPNLKVHCKTLLVVRKEEGRLRRYVHFGTGNYNDRTAELYTDLSLLSCDELLAEDAAMLFNLLTAGTEPPEKWNMLSVAPFDLRKTLTELIENEISAGKNGHIIAKMNSFSDPEFVRLIHHAACAGVKIDLIVRGICCLRPLKEEKNLRIISIVDRYLEHSRVFYFKSSGKLFCSSADWMPRNLDRRIEAMFPVNDEKIKKDILAILKFQLDDNAKQRRLLPSGNYTRPRSCMDSRSQKLIYDYFS
jgi:polyphosphate kinase